MSAASSSSCSSIVGSRDHASKSSLSSMPSEATTAALAIQLNQRCQALFRISPPQTKFRKQLCSVEGQACSSAGM